MHAKTKGAAAALVLLAAGMAGCGGGGGGGDAQRTSLSCRNDALAACMTMTSDVPATMSCTGGASEVASCSTAGILATCSADQSVFHVMLYVYSAAELSYWQAQCAALPGTWQQP